MKKVVILFAVLCAFAAPSFAQTATPTAATAEKEKMDNKQAMTAQKPESWKSLLALTPEQDAKMKEVNKAFKEKSDALKNDATLEKADKKAKMTELQASNETDLKAILSAEQFTKYIEIRNTNVFYFTTT